MGNAKKPYILDAEVKPRDAALGVLKRNPDLIGNTGATLRIDSDRSRMWCRLRPADDSFIIVRCDRAVAMAGGLTALRSALLAAVTSTAAKARGALVLADGSADDGASALAGVLAEAEAERPIESSRAEHSIQAEASPA